MEPSAEGNLATLAQLIHKFSKHPELLGLPPAQRLRLVAQCMSYDAFAATIRRSVMPSLIKQGLKLTDEQEEGLSGSDAEVKSTVYAILDAPLGEKWRLPSDMLSVAFDVQEQADEDVLQQMKADGVVLPGQSLVSSDFDARNLDSDFMGSQLRAKLDAAHTATAEGKHDEARVSLDAAVSFVKKWLILIWENGFWHPRQEQKVVECLTTLTRLWRESSVTLSDAREVLGESEILVKFNADGQKFFESDIDAAISHLWREVLFLIYHQDGVESLRDPDMLGRQALRAINSLGITPDIVGILNERIDNRSGPPSTDVGPPEEKYLFNEHWEDSTRAAVPEIQELLLEVSAHAVRNKKKNQKIKAKAKAKSQKAEEEIGTTEDGEDVESTAAAADEASTEHPLLADG